MKNILVVLLLIAVVILVFGAVNQDQRVDFDYIAGTWQHVSAFSLAGIGAGLTFVVGLCAAAVARFQVLSDRRKLEKELEQAYVRLRAAERAAGVVPPAAGAAADVETDTAVTEAAPMPAEGEAAASAASQTPAADGSAVGEGVGAVSSEDQAADRDPDSGAASS